MQRLDGEPAPVVVEHEGLRIAALDWGGSGMPLVLLHPNGFCAGLFDPIARRLTDAFRPVGIDLRAHGGSDATTDVPGGYAFAKLAGDAGAVLDALGIEEFVALGESLGGGVGSFLDALRPGAMHRLMLCDAIAFDVSFASGQPPEENEKRRNFMADDARKRREVWPDRSAVRERYASRPPLSEFAPEALDAYVRWGFVDRSDGQVELACTPEAEATMFEVSAGEQGALGAFQRLGALSATPVVLHGSSSHLPTPWYEHQAAQAGCELTMIGGGHLFLQEDTARAEGLVREHLAD